MSNGLRPAMTMRWLILTAVLWPAGAQAQPAADSPTDALSLHPQNNRYFLFRGKPTVLVTSAEHYGALLNSEFDFETYFQELSSHGLNHTRIFSGAYREVPASFGITQNPLAPSNQAYLCPWKRTDRSNPDGSPTFDLRSWDDTYFHRLDALMRSAGRHGIVVEMCLFCPMYKQELWDVNPMNRRNNINGVGDCGLKEVYTARDPALFDVQSALAEKMVSALAPYDNVYIEICNEPYFGGVTDGWQRKMIEVVRAAQQRISSRQLISINVANKTKRIENPHPAVSIFNFHYCHPPVVVGQNEHVRGVIGENETGFRGRADLLYRTEGWDFLVAGGGLYNNLDYSFSAEHPAGTLANYDSPGGGSRALRKQLSVLKSTFDRLPLVDLRPQPKDFVRAPDRFVASAIGQPGQVYLVYTHVVLPDRIQQEAADNYRRENRNVQLRMGLPAGRYRLEQIDPITGAKSEPSVIDANQREMEINLSPFQTDAAVLIHRQS
ncbi:hypothetical protein FYK55_18545 [Roseiconus nitratireducens]|uniref:Glycoside hydrolase family 5 domain-containing protein n=1 Tax=Roseiconus nitratireducens TaxID=2605748 RepID=A0A5M6D1M2_9BACT|nr:hypothetical protein [Roseiconus nitratireducens]KAA5540916.1 hypothetical protein FYK55_18545 [Roseiconus nitratireducens]